MQRHVEFKPLTAKCYNVVTNVVSKSPIHVNLVTHPLLTGKLNASECNLSAVII